MPIDRLSLLPPNATALERAIEQATARAADIAVPLSDLWNPRTCPIDLLPWLAWGLSIDRWEADWTEQEKRDQVALAIALQRQKGTRASLEAVLATFDKLLSIVEWFEAAPRRDPHTFEVMLPMDGLGGKRATAAFAEAVVRDITRFKPARSHFQLVQSVTCEAAIGLVAAGRAVRFDRADAPIAIDTSQPWDAILQTEEGEPFTDEDGATFLEER